MHSFLKTVGFRNMKSRIDVEQLVRLVIEQGAERYMATLGSKTMFANYQARLSYHYHAKQCVLFGQATISL